MNSTIITTLIVTLGSLVGSACVMIVGLKSNDTKQAVRDTSMKLDLKHISENQIKLTEKLDGVAEVQVETNTKVLLLEEKLKSTNTRIDNVEKDIKRK